MLHIIQKKIQIIGFEPPWVQYSKEGDVLLLIGDGVYTIHQHHPASKYLVEAQSRQQTVCALILDVQARGLHQLPCISGVEYLSDQDWVDFMVKHEHVQSW